MRQRVLLLDVACAALLALVGAEPSFAASLSQTLKELANEQGVVIKGLEKTKGAEAPEAHGSARERLKALLADFNYVVFSSTSGRIEVTITSARRPSSVAPLSEHEIAHAAQPVYEPTIASLPVAGVGEAEEGSIEVPPIEDAVISSDFGMRDHPILDRRMMHEGVDFAAAQGTPVYAAQNGVVQAAGWDGGYGMAVRIAHDGNLETAYGHLSRFADGLRPGHRVRAGELIGYVGSTGLSTGPHLHFEVLKDGQPVDPDGADAEAASLASRWRSVAQSGVF